MRGQIAGATPTTLTNIDLEITLIGNKHIINNQTKKNMVQFDIWITKPTNTTSNRSRSWSRSCSTGLRVRYNPCYPGQESLNPGIDAGIFGVCAAIAPAGDTQENITLAQPQSEGSTAVPLASICTRGVGAQLAGIKATLNIDNYETVLPGVRLTRSESPTTN